MFRYFAKPHDFSTYSVEPRVCYFCRVPQPGYDGPFFGLVDIDFVCEPCLRLGALQRTDSTTNEGDLQELRGAIHLAHQHLAEAERKALVESRHSELEQRTPHPLTWQHFFWPAHCSDYMRFEQEVGKRDIANLAAGADPVAHLKAHLQASSETDIDYLWEAMFPDESKASTGWDIGVYYFTCLECSAINLLWDAS